jgi:uncharacterized damage-inducible protein DinB
MFTKSGIIELHSTMHKRLDLLLHHVTTVPEALQHKPISGFCQPSIWKQLVHILTCEKGWVHNLQNMGFSGWYEEDCPTMAALVIAKDRIREATRAYLDDLTEEQLNTTLVNVPWIGAANSVALLLSCCMSLPTHFITKAKLLRC